MSSSERDQAIKEAQAAYQHAVDSELQLDPGPCIAESLPDLPDWVVDIAHDPREAVDDEATNQCQRYRDGEAHHFVELDPEGNLIRAQ